MIVELDPSFIINRQWLQLQEANNLSEEWVHVQGSDAEQQQLSCDPDLSIISRKYSTDAQELTMVSV